MTKLYNNDTKIKKEQKVARTNRKRESDDVVNPARSIKKEDRRSKRKNTKMKIQEIDCQNLDSLNDFEDEFYSTRGHN